MRKVTKGEYDYLPWRKRREIGKTILLFGISVAIFLLGYLSTKSKSNLLTIVAVLGCLPASKSAVSMIMYLRIRGCTKDIQEAISSRFGKDFGSYNLYFTSYRKNYEIHHLVVKHLSVIAYSQDKGTKAADFEEHIRTILKQDGITNYQVKLYQDLTKYMDRVDRLMELESENRGEDSVLSTLFAVSL